MAFDEGAPIRKRRECLTYLINRSQGSPKATTDLRMKNKVSLSASVLQATAEELAELEATKEKALAEQRGRLLGEGRDKEP